MVMDYVKLGERYGQLSNAHDLDGIRKMIAPNEKSTIIYGLSGTDTIIDGMKQFRKKYPRVTWIFPKGFIHVKSPTSQDKEDTTTLTRIEFFFRRYWVDPNGTKQQTFMCTATEYIDFTPDGLIQHIGYITHPSQPQPVTDYPTNMEDHNKHEAKPHDDDEEDGDNGNCPQQQQQYLSQQQHNKRILDFLDGHHVHDNKIKYETIHHKETLTSEESAHVRGVPLKTGGKALLLKVPGSSGGNDNDNPTFSLFVMSASCQLNSKCIKKELKVTKKNGGIRFATKEELQTITNGLVPGSVPPFGKPIFNNIKELYVDTSILENEMIAFNAGSLTDSVLMSVQDYVRISNPTKIFTFSK
ncbi:MAG: Ala-tRNA(Pro) deacylase [Bacillariaceae sp.]|jgi:Ala-tRNA(Pro) deacylase